MRASALAFALLSLPAFACPNLSGKYSVCHTTSGHTSATDLNVTQAIQNRATVYTMVSTDADSHESVTEVYRADGKTSVQTETDPDSGMKMSLATTVTCQGTTIVNAKFVLKMDGELVAEFATDVSKQGNKLVQETHGTNMGEEINETVICE